ncbi:class I SAM-dependent methyltransferase, partial [bacterium]|nr:class I SAM-dependent methyltransferase [bacterium]
IFTLGEEQPWNHNISLENGIETSPDQQDSHGKNLVKWARIKPVLDLLNLQGQRVLDIGCNEGFFSMKIAEMASYVMGGDIDKLRIKKAKFVQSIIKSKNLDFDVMDIYSSKFKKLDSFDLCICMGFLHRIPDPFTAVTAIAAKTDTVLFEWKSLKHGLHDEAYAYFSQKGVDEDDYYGTEYWLLSYVALESILKRQGFGYFYRIDDPRQRRSILVASKVDGDIFRLPDQLLHRGRIRALLSHTKRYLKTILRILNGQLNS